MVWNIFLLQLCAVFTNRRRFTSHLFRAITNYGYNCSQESNHAYELLSLGFHEEKIILNFSCMIKFVGTFSPETLFPILHFTVLIYRM